MRNGCTTAEKSHFGPHEAACALMFGRTQPDAALLQQLAGRHWQLLGMLMMEQSVRSARMPRHCSATAIAG